MSDLKFLMRRGGGFLLPSDKRSALMTSPEIADANGAAFSSANDERLNFNEAFRGRRGARVFRN